VVVAAEPVTDVDLTAAAMLGDLITELAAGGVSLVMAELKDPVKDRLKRYGLYDRVGVDRVYTTLGSAVDGYVDATGVDWTDWEERLVGSPPPR
jgi:MFS superfamily sulfate permease-like transporter